MELVSVVTPCYNASRFIADTIRSVQAQSYQNWEMLITDDCSTDNSRDIINEFAKKDPRIKLYKTELNSGHPSTPRNISLKHAKGEYVAFLDADDMWKHNKLEKHIAFIKQENCEISSTYCEIIDENGQQKGQIMRIKPKADYYDMLKNYELLSPTIICSKRIADKLYFPNCEQEDYVAWLSVLKHNIRGGYIINLTEALSYYRVVAGSRSRNKLHMLKVKMHILHYVEKQSVIKTMYYVLVSILYYIKKYYM